MFKNRRYSRRVLTHMHTFVLTDTLGYLYIRILPRLHTSKITYSHIRIGGEGGGGGGGVEEKKEEEGEMRG